METHFFFWGPADFLTQLTGTETPLPAWLNVITDLTHAKATIGAHNKPCILFVSEDVLKKNTDELSQLKSSNPKMDVVYINTSENTKTKIHWLKETSYINHLFPISSNITKGLFKRVLEEDWRKIFQQSPEKIFFPDNLDSLQVITMTRVDETAAAFDKVREFLATQPCFNGFADMMVTAASELLTNAFYNAPRDSDGKPMVADRHIKFALPDKQSIRFSFGKVNEYFWMSVTDSFGTLDRTTLINAMNRAAVERTAKTETIGGAGLGLIMLFEWASEIGFQLSRGISTTVACRFKMSKRQKEFDSEPSVFHVFSN